MKYIKNGDYYIPALTVAQERYHIGRFGRAYRRFLIEHKPFIYSRMLMSGTLLKHINEIDKLAQSTYENIMAKLAKDAPPMANQMEWVQFMNTARHIAEEIVYREIVYEEADSR